MDETSDKSNGVRKPFNVPKGALIAGAVIGTTLAIILGNYTNPKKYERVYTNVNGVQVSGWQEIRKYPDDREEYIQTMRSKGVQGLEKYDSRFSNVKTLHELGITPDIANRYDKSRFYAHDIPILFKSGVMPEAANAYDMRYSSDLISRIAKAYTPQEANAFSKEVDGYCIQNVPQEVFEKKLLNAAAEYPDVGCQTAIELKTNKISPATYKSYDRALNAVYPKDIIALINLGISVREAAPYYKMNDACSTTIDPQKIAFFKSQGETYESVAKLTVENFKIRVLTEPDLKLTCTYEALGIAK